MDLVILLVVAVAFLGALVVGLHKFQLSQTHHNADKSVPLPPLDSNSLEAEQIDSDATNGETPITSEPTSARVAKGSESKTKIENPEARENDPGEESWLSRVSQLKKNGNFDEALRVCINAFPLWSAYQQAVLIHRAKIKDLLKESADVSQELASLYQLAAAAAFLHSHVKDLPALSLAQLKVFNLSELQELEFPYLKIGFQELRLIKKTDIKLMLELWGKPQSHQNPRRYHSTVWLKLAAKQESLF